jgi:hypothetical protein
VAVAATASTVGRVAASAWLVADAAAWATGVASATCGIGAGADEVAVDTTDAAARATGALRVGASVTGVEAAGAAGTVAAALVTAAVAVSTGDEVRPSTRSARACWANTPKATAATPQISRRLPRRRARVEEAAGFCAAETTV